VFVALALGVVALAAACSDDEPSASSTSESSTSTTVVNTGPTVEIVGLSFAPAVETVTVGEAVTWTNDSGSVHTVTPRPLSDGTVPWESAQLEAGQTFVQTFNSPGTYEYFCSIHPDRMTGSVVVEPA
jgi:plastocyanin